MPMQVMRMVLSTVAAQLVLSDAAWADQTWLCAVSSAVAVDEDGTMRPLRSG